MLPSLFRNPPKLNPDMKARHRIAAQMIEARVRRYAEETQPVIDTYERLAA